MTPALTPAPGRAMTWRRALALAALGAAAVGIIIVPRGLYRFSEVFE